MEPWRPIVSKVVSGWTAKTGRHLAVFTDVDGTLIDHATYDYSASADAVSKLTARRIPVILCSSKTPTELQELQNLLELKDPYIAENGAVIGYRSASLPGGENWTSRPSVAYDRDGSEWRRVLMGEPREQLVSRLKAVSQAVGQTFQTYADLSVEEIIARTNLSGDQALSASRRLASETILNAIPEAVVDRTRALLNQDGLDLHKGGRFFTVTTSTVNKGSTVKILLSMMGKQMSTELHSVAVGDAPNDHEMLKQVDLGCLVQRPDQTWAEFEATSQSESLICYVDDVGPRGWALLVEYIISCLDKEL